MTTGQTNDTPQDTLSMLLFICRYLWS